jgi:hypothetical protein
VKVLVAVAVTPLLYAGHAVVERALGVAPLQVSRESELASSDAEDVASEAEPAA